MVDNTRQPMSADNRSEPRYNTQDSDCLDIYQDGTSFRILASREECEITNISKHGLMVRCKTPLDTFERFRLRFHLESGNELTLYGTVRWSVPDGAGNYLLGLLLEDVLGTDYLLWQNRLSKLLLTQAQIGLKESQLSA